MAQFVDNVRIFVQAGNGGHGCMSFRREKYIAAGGPDGGDGGHGGSVILRVDTGMTTLMDFRYKRKYAAENGGNGSGSNMKGRNGQNLIILVPLGTVVKEAESGQVIHDMSDCEDYVLAKGGRGGWGNQHFATPSRQAPRFAKSGLPGESYEIILELKLLADVGLVGFPNVGKSTLLSVVSNAHPKIANYHFTTLFPNLGVVYLGEGESFVMADIPGIIEGASEGVGLGHDFLRHIDRCRLLVHVVDVSGIEGRDPVEDFNTISEELRQYSPELASRPMIVVANKTDIMPDDSLLNELREHLDALGIPLYQMSAATHRGTKELTRTIYDRLKELPPIAVYEQEYVKPLPVMEENDRFTIEEEDGLWLVSSSYLERLICDINFDDYESRMFFDRQLRKMGLFEELEERGIQRGDTVSIYDLEFDYEP